VRHGGGSEERYLVRGGRGTSSGAKDLPRRDVLC